MGPQQSCVGGLTMRLNAIPFLLVPCLIALSVLPVRAQSPEAIEKATRELAIKQFQGYWAPELLITKEGAEKYPLGGRTLLFDGANFCRVEGKRWVEFGTFKIDQGILLLSVTHRNRWDIEAAGPKSDLKDSIQYSFKVDDDVLTLCCSLDNKARVGDLMPSEQRQVIVYYRKESPSFGTLPKGRPVNQPPKN